MLELWHFFFPIMLLLFKVPSHFEFQLLKCHTNCLLRVGPSALMQQVFRRTFEHVSFVWFSNIPLGNAQNLNSYLLIAVSIERKQRERGVCVWEWESKGDKRSGGTVPFTNCVELLSFNTSSHVISVLIRNILGLCGIMFLNICVIMD